MRLLLDLLFPPREDERVLRDMDADAFLACLAPRPVPRTVPETVALFPLADPAVRAAIHEAKYHGSARAFDLLAAGLADFLPDHLADRFDAGPTVLVPIPLGPRRKRERGYNQVEEVARRAARTLGMDIALDASLLVRTRETRTQVGEGRAERERNLRGAFRAAQVPLDPSHTYIVLDDVITTGATLRAAIEALLEGGARRERLVPIALSH